MNDELIALIIAGAIALGYCWIGRQNGRKS